MCGQTCMYSLTTPTACIIIIIMFVSEPCCVLYVYKAGACQPQGDTTRLPEQTFGTT